MFSACMISLQSGSCLSCKRMHSVTRAGTCCCKSGSKRHSCSSAATCAPGRYQTISCMHMGPSHHCIMQEQCRAARVYSGQGNRSAEIRRSGHLSSIDCSCLLGQSYLGFRIYAWRRCSKWLSDFRRDSMRSTARPNASQAPRDDVAGKP